jgi:hypothetical protein
MQRQNVMVGSLGTQKYLWTVFVDGVQAPAIGIELRLFAEIASAEADV